MTNKLKLSISIDPDLVAWIDKEVKAKRFATKSHAIEYALTQLIKGTKP